jgi:hypothetical protein
MVNRLLGSVRITKTKSVPVIAIGWFALAVFSFAVQLIKKSYNNYHIFKGSFWHAVQQTNLYAAYPNEYFDVSHYGPFFSVVIAPFAVLPDVIGCTLWCLLNAALLYYAILQLPFNQKGKLLVLLICLVEMATSMHNVQANPLVASWLVLSYVLVEKRKDFWAAAFIAAGFMVKIYGIVGLLFFVFSKKKFTFSWSFLFWMGLFFVLPMAFSSPSFIIQSYKDWAQVLAEKNGQNIDSVMQNISVIGMIQRIFVIRQDINLYVLAPAAILMLLPLLRFSQYKSLLFRLTYLCILLITIVVFSTGAESSTFIIAMVGVAAAFVAYPQSKWTVAILIFALLLTSFSTTDLFPRYVREHFLRPYSLKALPCFIVWLLLVAQLYWKDFNKQESGSSYLANNN